MSTTKAPASTDTAERRRRMAGFVARTSFSIDEASTADEERHEDADDPAGDAPDSVAESKRLEKLDFGKVYRRANSKKCCEERSPELLAAHPAFLQQSTLDPALFPSGGYDGPNSGNRWYENADEIPGFLRGAAASADLPDSPVQFEYLDHTADVQLHSWGRDHTESLAQLGVAMFNYMTGDFAAVETRDVFRFSATADDVEGLVFHFLDELLFAFAAEPFFVAKKVIVESLRILPEGCSVSGEAYGEPFDVRKHKAGTEIKAITYSAMNVYSREKGDKTEKGNVEIFVIVDI